MSTILEAMRAKALAEFDHLTAQREKELRTDLRAAGHSIARIDSMVAANRPNVAAQRANVPFLVAIKLLEHGVLNGDSNVLD